MDWFGSIDAYCERYAPGFGAEPLNMMTGLAFLLAGALAFRRAPTRPDRHVALALALVGVASAVQHGLALQITFWADLAANVIYLVLLGSLMLRRLAGVSVTVALIGAGSVVLAANTVLVALQLRAVFGIATDTFFLLLLVLLGAALAMRRSQPTTARSLAVAAVVLAAGLPFRFLDAAVCEAWPIGTHWLWHLVNAISAALVLAALARHTDLPAPVLAKGRAGR